MRGRLIVLEGTDGSGKATQAKLLLRSLEDRGVPCREIDFPRYGSPFAQPAGRHLPRRHRPAPGHPAATGRAPPREAPF